MEEIEISASVTREADPEIGANVDGNISVGVPGPKGDKGDPGEPGKDGKNGKDGKSAYQYALDGGYTGTEEEFAELMANGTGSGGGSSVQSDWNQNDETQPDFIKNKPFGEGYGDTLTWDGNTEGKVRLELGGDVSDPTYMVKVSDSVPGVDDFVNGFSIDLIEPTTGYQNFTITGEQAQSFFDDNGFAILGGMAIVCPTDGYISEGMHIPEKGVYLIGTSSGSLYIPSLTIPGHTGFPVTKKLDSKYLPEDYINSLIDAKLGVIENGSY